MLPWTKNETSKLITFLHQQPLLYCTKHPQYSNRQSRHNALSTICRQMAPFKANLNSAEIKTKLKTLRSQYTKEKTQMLKSIRECSKDMYVPRLWCYEELQIFDLEYPPMFPSPDFYDSESESETEPIVDPLMEQMNRKRNSKAVKIPEKLLKTEFKREASSNGSTSSTAQIETSTQDNRTVFEMCRTPQAQLGKIVEWELLQVTDEVFYDTKWKIMKLLENASKQYALKKENSHTRKNGLA